MPGSSSWLLRRWFGMHHHDTLVVVRSVVVVGRIVEETGLCLSVCQCSSGLFDPFLIVWQRYWTKRGRCGDNFHIVGLYISTTIGCSEWWLFAIDQSFSSRHQRLNHPHTTRFLGWCCYFSMDGGWSSSSSSSSCFRILVAVLVRMLFGCHSDKIRFYRPTNFVGPENTKHTRGCAYDGKLGRSV